MRPELPAIEGVAVDRLQQAVTDIVEINPKTPAAVYTFPYVLQANGHGLIQCPEPHQGYPPDYNEDYETNPEFIFWRELMMHILEPGKEYVIRGSCIQTLALEKPSSLEHLPFFFRPLDEQHSSNRELADPDNPVLHYLRQFVDFKPNIDIYVDEEVIKRLLERPILGGSIEKIILDNGAIGYRIIYDIGYAHNQGVNLVLKPPSNDRRLPLDYRSSHAVGKMVVEVDREGDPEEVRVYVKEENVLALHGQASFDSDAVQALPPAEQLVQIARFLRFNALDQNPRTTKPRQFPQENLDRVSTCLAAIQPEDIFDMPLDLAAAIGSELLTAFLSNPEVVITLVNQMNPDLFPYLNRENLRDPKIQEQLVTWLTRNHGAQEQHITWLTRSPLDWRHPRTQPTLDTSGITRLLENQEALNEALADIKLDGDTYEPESDIYLTWEMSEPGDIVPFALLFCPIHLRGRAQTQREIVYDPSANDEACFAHMTYATTHGARNYRNHLRGFY